MEDEFGTFTFLFRSYFSIHHLWAAEHFSRLARGIENKHEGRPHFYIEHRVYVVNSLLSATAFLEAAINELFQDAHDRHLAYIEHLDEEVVSDLADFWNKTDFGYGNATLQKYEVALSIGKKDPFVKGKNPYQDANLVIKIRNFLTHYKPKNVGGDEIHDLQKSIIGKFPETKTMSGSGNPYFPDKALGYGCTEWALRSVRSFADSFFDKMQIVPNYQRADFSKHLAP